MLTMRLIDADTLHFDIVNTPSKLKNKGPFYLDGTVDKQNEILEMIEQAQTIDTEPVIHAHWVRHTPDVKAMKTFHKKRIGLAMSEKSIFWTCSNCNCWGTLNQKRCSECGAKMDEEQVCET